MSHHTLLLISLCLMFFSSQAQNRQHHNRLNPQAPVQVSIQPDSICVTYLDTYYRLNEKTILLDGELSNELVAQSPYLFNNVREALSHVSAGSDSIPMRLLIAPGVYWIDDPDDNTIRRTRNSEGTPYGMVVDCPHLHMIGLATQPQHIVLASNRGQTQGAIGNFTMLQLIGDGLAAENITFGNYCNVDLQYDLDPSRNRSKRANAIVQAQLVHCKHTDKAYIRNCHFISRLNLCPFTGARRTLFENCHFECTDDALAGSAIYYRCHFTFFSSKPFYASAAHGAVFLDCDIDTHTRNTQYLTKAGGSITMIDTRIRTLYDASASPLRIKWTPYSTHNICYMHHVTLNGQPVNIEGNIPSQTVDLTGKPLLQAYRITHNGQVIYNIPNLLAGDDQWDPLSMRASIQKIAEQTQTPLLNIPTLLQIAPGRVSLDAQGDRKALQAKLLYWGGYDRPSDVPQSMWQGSTLWDGPNTLKLQATQQTALKAECISQNRFAQPVASHITTTLSSGLRGIASVQIAPYYVEAPTWQQTPVIDYDKKDKSLVVEYALSAASASDIYDNSVITWYRYTADDLSDTIAVQRDASHPACRRYTLQQPDKDYKILVSVTPRYSNSYAGTQQSATYDKHQSKKFLPVFLLHEGHMETDFHNIPVQYQPALKQGFWTFDAYKPADTQSYNWQPQPKRAWYYGFATDGAKGKGLVQATKGARMFYTPARDKCQRSSVTLHIDPCKTAGQGFGSATGQYMDIYIKFDATTLTGYALRIERTPQYDKAVVFTLLQYENGVVTPISEPVASSCFRSTCTITLSLKGTRLIATATTTAKTSPQRGGIAPNVSLSANVQKNDYTQVGIQHTGSTGGSAAMIKRFEADWE